MSKPKKKPVVLDAADPGAWRDWERVLVYWREMGHDGITLAGLAELTGRTARAITREMKARRTFGGCVCGDIEAPVFIARYHAITDYAAPTAGDLIKWYNQYYFYADNYGSNQITKFWRLVQTVPGPQSWPVGKGALKNLRKVASGDMSPWIRKVLGNYAIG